MTGVSDEPSAAPETWNNAFNWRKSNIYEESDYPQMTRNLCCAYGHASLQLFAASTFTFNCPPAPPAIIHTIVELSNKLFVYSRCAAAVWCDIFLSIHNSKDKF